MTATELKAYIIAQLAAPVDQVQKVINCLSAVVDYASSINAEIIPEWSSALTFKLDGTSAGKYCKFEDLTGNIRIFETKVSNNINNTPPSNPSITFNSYWEEISPSSGSGIKEWSAGLFGAGLIIVYHDHSVDGRGWYILTEATRPFNSTDIEAETTANKWVRFGGGIIGGGTAATTTFTPAGNLSATDVQAAFQELDTEKQASLGFTPENTTNKGTAGGYASLDGSGKVPSVQLPSYVDDVVEYANYAALPVTGATGIIYIAIDTNKEYRWSGSAYVELVASPGSSDVVPEGVTNLYFTAARVLASLLAGLSTATNAVITASDTVLSALGKLQKQITDLTTSIGLKLTANTSITGATKTKVTYDSNGLVTSGTDATTADIADSANKRYVTDSDLTKLGNTSGSNTGDQDLSGLAVKANNLSDLTNPATARANLGLGNVDNTSDSTKNAATATLTNKTLTSPVINSPTGLVKGDVGLGNVDNTADSAKPVSAAQAAADAAVLASANAHSDALVVGLWDDRGNFDASGGAYPSSGGSGSAGAILKGDIWTISVAGTLPTGQVVAVGDTIRAKQDTPGNTQANWAIQENNIGYVPENVTNKDATGGYAGLTLFKINFKNALNTFTSFFTNANTAARTYTFQDRDGTIADNTDLALKAPLASPTFTGTPSLPTGTTGVTQAAADNSTKLATTAYADTAAASGVPDATTSVKGKSELATTAETITGTDTVRTITPAGLFATIPFVTPESYGAVGDGVTNDQAAIQLAVDSGFPVYFRNKTYLVNTTVTLTANTKIFGSGSLSIIKTTSNIAIITIGGIECSIKNLTFVGNNTGAAQTGVSAVGNAGFTLYRYSTLVSNCKFLNLNFAGLYAYYTIGSSSGSNHEGTYYAQNCYAYNCGVGFFMDTRGEYNTFVNCVASGCTVGVKLNGGNNNWQGGQLVDCTTGVYIGSGTNDGHGVMSGAKLNHNGSSITCVSTANGFLFVGCMIYAGSITLTSCTGIKLIGCEMSSAPITSTTAVNTQIHNCKFVTDPTITIVSGSGPTYYNNTFNTGTVHASNINTIQGQVQFATSLSTGQLEIRNPANTFSYKIGGGALVTADRNVNFPVITGNETFVLTTVAQTLTNKTLGSGTALTVSPTISDGLRITFNPDNTTPGVNLGVNASDPSSPTNGDFWNNSTTGHNMMRDNNKTLALDGSYLGTGTLDFPSTAAQSSSDLTITVTGAALGDPVILGVPHVSVVANSSYTAWVSAANTVTVRLNNYSAASIDPASGTFNIKVTPY